MLSGPDYVRRVAPGGVLSTYTSIANLNMGEVAVQRQSNAGGVAVAANVAFAYICCASCGCARTPPQGVGHVQSNGSLPVVVPATVTSGAGPFGVTTLDTGPYGLSVSALGEFFVGNVRANGDLFRYDTDTESITALAADVQSLRRDAFTGRFYAALRNGTVVSFAADGTGVTTETSVGGSARVAVSPDGWLYVLRTVGGPLTRIALPTTR